MEKVIMLNLLLLFLIFFVFTCKDDTVSSNDKNTAPKASFIFFPSSGDISTTFQFDASASSDNEDSFPQLRFSWDWENDGSWDVNNSKNYSPSHQYSSVCVYTVRLEVMDSANLFDTITNTINIDTPETGSVTDIEGNIYQTQKIGNQWWMTENLKVTHYSNGESIPLATDNVQWTNLTTGGYCNYNNNFNNVVTYGRLYNWYAVIVSRNIAPVGWHVPTDDEWKELEIYLGMSQSQADSTGFLGTDEGGKLKETGTAYWNASNNGATNSSGFKALPGGYRIGMNGAFFDLGNGAYFWSSTEYNGYGSWYCNLNCNNSQVSRHDCYKLSGFSVRCVKD
jgi:uncharacterized protein (TIGR02145 family)